MAQTSSLQPDLHTRSPERFGDSRFETEAPRLAPPHDTVPGLSPVIREFDTLDGRVIEWTKPAWSRRKRVPVTLFVLAWLAVWCWLAAGVFPGLWADVRGAIDAPAEGENGASGGWTRAIVSGGVLIVWSIAGLLVARTLWHSIRPQRPERLTFRQNVMVYEPGTVGVPVFLDITRPEREREDDPVTFDRGQLTTARLDPSPERAHRLLVDVASQCIPIGRRLRDADRRYLFDRIEAWRAGGLGG